jgi:hypothetical protein
MRSRQRPETGSITAAASVVARMIKGSVERIENARRQIAAAAVDLEEKSRA